MVPTAPDPSLCARWQEDLAERVARPGEVWVVLGMLPDGAPQPEASTTWALGRRQLRIEGAWRGHACQPAVVEHSLDGLLIAQEDGDCLHSCLAAWLDCVRHGGRLLLLSQGRGGSARRGWLRALSRLSERGELRWVAATDYRRRGNEIVARRWPQPGGWQSRLALARAAAAQLEFVREGSTPQLALRSRPPRERVAISMPGVTRV